MCDFKTAFVIGGVFSFTPQRYKSSMELFCRLKYSPSHDNGWFIFLVTRLDCHIT